MSYSSSSAGGRGQNDDFARKRGERDKGLGGREGVGGREGEGRGRCVAPLHTLQARCGCTLQGRKGRKCGGCGS